MTREDMHDFGFAEGLKSAFVLHCCWILLLSDGVGAMDTQFAAAGYHSRVFYGGYILVLALGCMLHGCEPLSRSTSSFPATTRNTAHGSHRCAKQKRE